ncbi:MAG: hypothetical protein HND48_07245 [Chloroflexi bacterium]|nr:hypothetical protein [Chloroflexota bacterium]
MNAQDSTSRALPPMIDTHIHLNFDAYDEDRDAVIARAAAAGVARCINPGVDLETSRAGIDLAAAYPGVIYAAVGYHPNSTAGFARAWLEPIRAGVVSGRREHRRDRAGLLLGQKPQARPVRGV